jgi:hypothetical protein
MQCSSAHTKLHIAQYASQLYFLDLLEGVWRRGCRILCARFAGEWNMEVHATGTGDVLEKQAGKTPHDGGLDKPCTLYMGEGDWLWRGARFNLAVRGASR